MEHETDLVGERRTATGAIGGELRLMQLDQIFGLAARAIQAVVDPLGRADIEAGDDEADVVLTRPLHGHSIGIAKNISLLRKIL
jgi:hypothetical protein